MSRALDCAKWVIVGIGIVMGFVLVSAMAIYLLVFASSWSAYLLGFDEKSAPLFGIVYTIVGFGAAVGISLCRESQP